MLSERQRVQGSVKCPPGLSDSALVHEELTVIHPNARHLVVEGGNVVKGGNVAKGKVTW